MDEPRTFTVTIAPHGWTFEAPDDYPLMVAARLAHIAFPASCRNGTCRTCVCRVVSGKTHHGIEWPGLSAEEKRDGYILPCVAYADSDVTLDVPLAKQMD
jgi:ferredoxin